MNSLTELFKNMEYGPAPESAEAVNLWLQEHDRSFGLLINNQWVHPAKAKTYASINPANGEKLAETIQAGQAEVDQGDAAGSK